MVNSNPETVSTDYDTSDKLYFEPLTLEDVLGIVDKEHPDGVIVQFGGQTPLNLAIPLKKAGVPILGTTPEDIDRAEDREKFQLLLKKLGLIEEDERILQLTDRGRFFTDETATQLFQKKFLPFPGLAHPLMPE